MPSGSRRYIGVAVSGSQLITLAISKCYGKVRVLFFPRDNFLISRGNSHVSRVRGLVVRCLLFNPEVSCSNAWVCANFFNNFSEAESSHIFRHYEIFRLYETFFSKFFKCPQKVLSFFLIFCNKTNVKKSQKVPLFSEFSALWDCSKFSFLFCSKIFKRLLIFCFFFSKIFNVYRGSTLLFV